MIDWIIEALQWFWDWLVWTVGVLADGLVNGFIRDLPVFDGTGFEVAADYLEVANQWLPLDFLMLALATMWTFILAFIIVKFIWKAIPTTG